MSEAPELKPSAWPDGTPRSQDNAFAVLYVTRAPGACSENEKKRHVSTRTKALPFCLPGTRVRTR